MKPRAPRFASLACAAGLLAWSGPAVFAATNRVAVTPPVPSLHSPVDAFRRLLVMPSTDRKEYLETRNAEVRTRLVEKIREYQSLTPEERELKLKATELRWYLEPLLKAAATNRAARVALIPEGMREMVTARLDQWDKLPSFAQQLILTNQHGPTYIASVATATNLPPSPVNAIRRKLTARFEQYFDLTANEKQTVLASLSEAERQQMEKTLAAFQKLSIPQRRMCLNTFKKFADMNPEARQDFLKNAQRWEQMSPTERQSWRELVSAAPNLPPLPIVSVPKPRLPADPRKPAAPPTTNGG